MSLRLFTVYEDPKDYPGQIVVRGFTIQQHDVRPDKEALYVGPDIMAAREKIIEVHPGAYRLNRQPGDEPQIVEVWI